MSWTILNNARGYAVYQDGKKVSGRFSSYDEAQGTLVTLRRAATRRTRPCMCCSQTFLSEGIHNRLCLKCRHRSDTSDLGIAI